MCELGKGLQAAGILEADGGLVASGGRAVDLGRRFVVDHETVERNGRGERRLAVALAHLDVGRAKAAEALDVIPTEDAADDERLKVVQKERFPRR